MTPRGESSRKQRTASTVSTLCLDHAACLGPLIELKLFSALGVRAYAHAGCAQTWKTRYLCTSLGCCFIYSSTVQVCGLFSNDEETVSRHGHPSFVMCCVHYTVLSLNCISVNHACVCLVCFATKASLRRQRQSMCRPVTRHTIDGGRLYHVTRVNRTGLAIRC